MFKYEISLPDVYPLDFSQIAGLELLSADQREQFERDASAAVDRELEKFGVSTEKDVRELSLDDWSSLRNGLLGIKVASQLDIGEAHE